MKKKFPMRLRESGSPGKYWIHFRKKREFSEEEKRTIKNAVRGHRRLRDGEDTLEKLLYEADKASRLCLSCPANRECNWSEEKKNMEIKI